MSGLTGSSKWIGGVLASNVKIYGIQSNIDSVLIIDPQINTYDTTTITGLTGSAKWAGGVLAPNGKIYGIPDGSTSVLIIDPNANISNISYQTGTAFYNNLTNKLSVNNGSFTSQLLTGDNIIITNNLSQKFTGYVQSIDNDNLCTFIFNLGNNVGNIISLQKTRFADITTMTGLVGTVKFYGGVLAPNGKIYCIPLQSNIVLIIDPQTNTYDTTTLSGLTSGGFKWAGGVLATNGNIYGIPHNSSNVIIINPQTNTYDTSTITGISGSAKYVGGVVAQNGIIYGFPNSATNVLQIKTGLPTIGDWCLGAQFNKF